MLCSSDHSVNACKMLITRCCIRESQWDYRIKCNKTCIIFSSLQWKKVKSLSRDSFRPHGAHQAPPSMGFFRQEYWSGLPFPPPDLPDPGTKPASLTSPALVGGFFITSATWKSNNPCWISTSCVVLHFTDGETEALNKSLKISRHWDFPGGPVVKALHSQCRGPRFSPWTGN